MLHDIKISTQSEAIAAIPDQDSAPRSRVDFTLAQPRSLSKHMKQIGKNDDRSKKRYQRHSKGFDTMTVNKTTIFHVLATIVWVH